jgi:hypothetical protein
VSSPPARLAIRSSSSITSFIAPGAPQVHERARKLQNGTRDTIPEIALAKGRKRWQGGGMGTRLVHIVIDANDPGRLARFWAAALGWEVADETPDEVDVWPADFSYPDPVALPLVFVPVPASKTTQNRVHLDLATRSREDQLTTIRRLLTLGATHIDIGQGDAVERARRPRGK